MKQGDKVKIYQKPLTEEDLEGEATLIRKNKTNDLLRDTTESWLVRFEGEDREVERIIKQ